MSITLCSTRALMCLMSWALSPGKVMPSATKDGSGGSALGQVIKGRRLKGLRLNLPMLLRIRRNGGKMTNIVRAYF